MAEIDGLEQAIWDWVDSFETRPVGELEPIRLAAHSVVLHRVKECGGEWLWFITCESPSHPEQGVWAWSGWATKAGSDGWRVHAIGGAGGHPLRTGRTWANLACQLLVDGFRAGGWVELGGRSITDVRLVDTTGLELIDQVENQVALFRADRPVELSLIVQLINASGAVAVSHQVP